MTLASNSFVVLAIAASAGFALGFVFYGGLYWTVSRGLASKNPALWFIGSLLVRVVIVLAGFYFVSSYPVQVSPAPPHSAGPILQMERLISCLVTFTITGLIIRWFTREHGGQPCI
ncbi:MAG: ATP synthase subunit I [Candidatus Melainabacteria bacterium]|nr:ATP synthase subunit I [Candidatus Melainabacteria bacterium]